MSALPIILVAGFALMLMTVLLVSLPPVRRQVQERYQQLDDSQLAQGSETAQMMLARLTLVRWVAPMALALLVLFIRHELLTTAVLSLLLFIVFGNASARYVYWRILRIANSELERRRSKREADGQCADPDTGGESRTN